LALVIGGYGLREVLLVLLLCGAVQISETFYLTPKILGRELQLHPLVVFAAVVAGALVLGPFGALVAAPLVAILLLIYRKLVVSDRTRRDQPGRIE
jgi:predicted PurR-regulated permease PerM